MQQILDSSENISAGFLGKYLSNIHGVEIEPPELGVLVSKAERPFEEQRQKFLELGNRGFLEIGGEEWGERDPGDRGDHHDRMLCPWCYHLRPSITTSPKQLREPGVPGSPEHVGDKLLLSVGGGKAGLEITHHCDFTGSGWRRKVGNQLWTSPDLGNSSLMQCVRSAGIQGN